jgi:hypothetical protein
VYIWRVDFAINERREFQLGGGICFSIQKLYLLTSKTNQPRTFISFNDINLKTNFLANDSTIKLGI